jgi:hypothetical protein
VKQGELLLGGGCLLPDVPTAPNLPPLRLNLTAAGDPQWGVATASCSPGRRGLLLSCGTAAAAAAAHTALIMMSRSTWQSGGTWKVGKYS